MSGVDRIEEAVVEALIELDRRLPEGARRMFVIGGELVSPIAVFEGTGAEVDRVGPVVAVFELPE